MTSEQQVDQRSEVICPECGTSAQVALNRREALDFCTRCDFPLFWTPSEVIRDGGEGSGENLRRLPGTAGRVTVAAVPCPTCAEANPVGAATCLRCGGPMVLITAPEPIAAVAPPPPPPAPAPAPEPTGIDWYWWLVGGATLIALIALIVVVLAR